jgi:hypothetical protein
MSASSTKMGRPALRCTASPSRRNSRIRTEGANFGVLFTWLATFPRDEGTTAGGHLSRPSGAEQLGWASKDFCTANAPAGSVGSMLGGRRPVRYDGGCSGVTAEIACPHQINYA